MEIWLALALLTGLVLIRALELLLLWRMRRTVLEYVQTRALLELALERGAHTLAARTQAELLEIERRLPPEVAQVLSAQTRGLLG